MTAGGEIGTSGWPRGQWRPWLAVTLIVLVVVSVNATSVILESLDDGHPAWWEPVVWEGSSAIIILALAPFIGRAIWTWPRERANLTRFALIHFGLTFPFSAIHIAAIVIMRNAVYWLAHARYGFFDDGVALRLLYEWRKDVLVYAAVAAVYWWFQSQAARSQPLPTNGRLEIRDGGAAVFLSPADILYVEAAGNYVEFHTAARTHLVRGTLASWESRLTQRGFLRVHRSRLINRARISALKPTPSGDIEITLDDGRNVAGSRRYRDAFENAPLAP